MGQIYAKGTQVSVEKSEAELKGLLRRHGADGLATFEDRRAGRAMVAFELKGRNVRLEIPLPEWRDYLLTKTGKRGLLLGAPGPLLLPPAANGGQ